jgi:hypothetical protein
MMYLKMICEGAKRHLIPTDQGLEGVSTLCGCTITRPARWRAVAALEGDECEKCAAVSFSVTKLSSWLESSDRDSREGAVTKQAE